MAKQTKKVRVSLDLSSAELERLSRLVEAGGFESKAALLRLALQLLGFVVLSAERGWTFYVVKGDKEQRVVLLDGNSLIQPLGGDSKGG